MLAEILCWARGKKFYLTDGLLHNIKRATESSADVQLLWVVQHLDANWVPALRKALCCICACGVGAIINVRGLP